MRKEFPSRCFDSAGSWQRQTRLANSPSRTSCERLSVHQAGDWGDVCDDDRQANNRALTEGTRLLSVYHSATGVKFWIITEADRSITTVLCPEDY